MLLDLLQLLRRVKGFEPVCFDDVVELVVDNGDDAGIVRSGLRRSLRLRLFLVLPTLRLVTLGLLPRLLLRLVALLIPLLVPRLITLNGLRLVTLLRWCILRSRLLPRLLHRRISSSVLS